jgi:uncharacterized protein YcfJ
VLCFLTHKYYNMNTMQIRNIAIGAVAGYGAGYVVGKFMKPEYKQHIALGMAILGGYIGYNMKSEAAVAAPAATVAAPAAAEA